MNRTIIIGSRGSDLALCQAHFIQDQLREQSVESEIKIIKTQGDKIQHLGFDKMEGKGFFTKEIESALLEKEIDLAVHSHKDLETTSPKGLTVAAISERANPSELLLMHHEAWDAMQPLRLKKNAVVGTSAARRKAQLLSIRPDFEINDLRGNVPTRIDKLRKGNYDAILVARAGVDRLGLDLSEFIFEELDPHDFIPAPAQGVLAFQVREDDSALIKVLGAIHNTEVAGVIDCERSVLKALQGGCQMPFGAHCEIENGRLHYWSFLAERGGGASRRLYMNIPVESFATKDVLKKLQAPTQKKVLVTREMHPAGPARKMLIESGCQLIEQPFINVKPQTPETPDFNNYQWLFFISPNAVKHFPFFDKIHKDVKVAALGKGTTAALNELGVEVDFAGLGQPSDVARVFRAELSDQQVLIVCGTRGMRSIQKALNANQFDECAVYETEAVRVELNEQPNILAFTSPSNVRAFFKSNKLPAGSEVVSIGASTARTLEEFEVDCTISWESSEQALADTILGLC